MTNKKSIVKVCLAIGMPFFILAILMLGQQGLQAAMGESPPIYQRVSPGGRELQDEADSSSDADVVSYVDADASGEGTGLSWTDAYTNLQDALDQANSDSGTVYEIWVAEGIYYPDEDSDGDHSADVVTETFTLSHNNVRLYGGFAATETLRAERDWDAHLTVLSGDIDGNDVTDVNGVVTNTAGITGTNAYHVVFVDGTGVQNVTAETVIDGFTITAGHAHAAFPNDNDGGGLFCSGGLPDNESSPSVSHVVFSGNLADRHGGGVFNAAGNGGASSPVLTDVTFTGNRAGSGGGGLYNDGWNGGVSSPTLTDVTFSDNHAVDGGGMYNYGQGGGTSSPILTNVTFNGNQADGSGGGLSNKGEQGTSSPSLSNVTFTDNQSVWHGGGMFSWGDGGTSSPILTTVVFSDNQAGGAGAGMFNLTDEGTGSPILTDVTFSGNQAGWGGGGMGSHALNGGTSSPTLENVTFSNNHANRGGGMHIHAEAGINSPALTGVMFSNNHAAEGGGMHCLAQDGGESNPALTDVTFSGNQADAGGGGMLNDGNGGTSSPALKNVIVTGNQAGFDGGGIHSAGSNGGNSSPALINVTLSGNHANRDGGGLFNYSSSGTVSPTLTNTVLWGNTADANGPQIYNDNATPSISHSDVEGSGGSGAGWDSSLGTDDGQNLDADPLFVDADGADDALGTLDDDLHLQLGSPCIDAGTSAGAPVTDFEGDPRPTGAGYDIGADEAPSPATPTPTATPSPTPTPDGTSAAAWTQTDWSGGSGQPMWSDPTRYDSSYGVNVATSGEISLGYTAPAGGSLSDLNQDGYPDLLFGSQLGDAYLYYGGPQGFSNDRHIRLPQDSSSWGTQAVAAADVNDDGYLDVIIGSNGQTRFYWGSENGYDVDQYDQLSGDCLGISLADLDGDGHLDLVCNQGEGRAYVNWGNASGFDETDRVYLDDDEVTGGASYVADLDQDGYLDILLSKGQASPRERDSYIYWGGASGYSSANRTGLPTKEGFGIQVADLNEDGFLDIVWCNLRDDAGNKDIDSTIYWGSAAGYGATDRTGLPTNGATSAAVADLDDDGHLDIVFANSSTQAGTGSIYIYWGSSGTYSADDRSTLSSVGSHDVGVEDLNLDGYLDIVSVNYWTNEEAYIFWGGPDGYDESNRHGLSNGGTGLALHVVGGRLSAAKNSRGSVYAVPITGTTTITDVATAPRIHPASGVLTSSALDQSELAAWSAMTYTAAMPTGTDVQMAVDTSDDGVTWSGWITVATTSSDGANTVDLAAAGVPSSRYLRHRITLQGSDDHRSTPTVYDVRITGSGSSPGCVAPPQGLLNWWPGDGDASDIVGENDGALHGGLPFVSGMAGQAFSFDGDDDYLEASDSGMPMGADPRTLEFWMKVPFDARVPVVYGHNQSLDSYYVVVLQDHVCIGNPFGGPYEVCGSTDVADGGWHHVGLTYDGTKAVLYLDGAVEASVDKPYDTTSTGSFHIGLNGGYEYFTGLVDEVSLYDRALTPSEIQAIYAGGAAGKCRGEPQPTPTPTATPTATPTPTPTSTPVPSDPPVVTSIEPDNGPDDQITWVTVLGANFVSTSEINLVDDADQTTPLNSVSWINSSKLLGAVPAAMSAGVYDVQVCNPVDQCGTLANGYTVVGTQPTLLEILPNQGFNDVPNDVTLYGYNLQSGIAITVAGAPLEDANWINATQVQGVVPAGLSPGTYDVVGRNAGSVLTDAIPNGYTVLDPGGDDFFATADDIWTAPTTIREGETVMLGVNVHRQGGKDTLQVEVSFYLGDPAQGGQLLDSVSSVPIPPGAGGLEPVYINWDTTGLNGTAEIHVVIDPSDAIPEVSELNNTAWRQISILSPVVDDVPPGVTLLQVNGGALSTDDPQVCITIEAQDFGDPSSGVSTMYLAEREFNASARQWVAVQRTGWIPFQSPYTMTLASDRSGVRYIQAWVADNEGNISEEIYKASIEYLPLSDTVRAGQVRIYRRTLDVGQTLQVTLETLSGDADLYVWSPDGTQSWVSNNAGTATDEVSLTAPQGGEYQIEVYGYEDSTYHLDILTDVPVNELRFRAATSLADGKPERGQPVIAPNSQPAGNSAVPSAPIACSLEGDLNLDRVVDIFDIMMVVNHWRCEKDDPCYDASCDVDGDDDIDVVDIMLVVAHWGDTCD